MLRTLLHQTGVQQVQSMYTHRSREKFGYLHADDINNSSRKDSHVKGVKMLVGELV